MIIAGKKTRIETRSCRTRKRSNALHVRSATAAAASAAADAASASAAAAATAALRPLRS